MSSITIRSTLLKALAGFAYEGSDRPEIAGVLFGLEEVIATNGVNMVRVPKEIFTDHDPDPDNDHPDATMPWIDTPFMVMRDHIIAALHAQENLVHDGSSTVGEKLETIARTLDQADVEIAVTGAMIEIVVLRTKVSNLGLIGVVAPAGPHVNFPQLSKMNGTCQDHEVGNEMWFNPRLMSAMHKVCSAAEGDSTITQIGWPLNHQGRPGGPMCFQSPRGIRFYLMPMLPPKDAAKVSP